jgi:hypothetical protein
LGGGVLNFVLSTLVFKVIGTGDAEIASRELMEAMWGAVAFLVAFYAFPSRERFDAKVTVPELTATAGTQPVEERVSRVAPVAPGQQDAVPCPGPATAVVPMRAIAE